MSRLQYTPRFSLEIRINDTKINIENNQDSYYAASAIQKYVNFLSLCTIKIDPTKFSDTLKNKSGGIWRTNPFNIMSFQNTAITINTLLTIYRFQIGVGENSIPFSYSIPIFYNSSQ